MSAAMKDFMHRAEAAMQAVQVPAKQDVIVREPLALIH
jgi:hypothetical protein